MWSGECDGVIVVCGCVLDDSDGTVDSVIVLLKVSSSEL